MDNEEHYSQLLGIHSPWLISHVDLKMHEQRVDIEIEYGVKTVAVPLGGKNSSFTMLFEGFAIRVLQAARSIRRNP
jgi:hypothetical protein